MSFQSDWNDFCNWCVKQTRHQATELANRAGQQTNEFFNRAGERFEEWQAQQEEARLREEEELMEALEQYRINAGIKSYNGDTRILLKGYVTDWGMDYIKFSLYDIPYPFSGYDPWDFYVREDEEEVTAWLDSAVIDESSVPESYSPPRTAAVEVRYDPYEPDFIGDVTRVFFFPEDAFEEFFEQAKEVYMR